MCTAAFHTRLDSSSISTRLVMVDMKAGSVPVSCKSYECVSTFMVDAKLDMSTTYDQQRGIERSVYNHQ